MSKIARENFSILRRNPYPGRGIIVGTDQTNQYIVQIYWIMGRKPNSQNRVFGKDEGRLFTEAADPSKMKDPRLIIYDAMIETGGHCVVSNGHQTNDVALKLSRGYSMRQVLQDWMYEPDEPNFTPRITAVTSFDSGYHKTQMAVIRKSWWDDSCVRCHYEYERIAPGFGFCITTYEGDGDPLPSFTGEPILMPLEGNSEYIAATYWDALNAENRVSLAVKFIPLSSQDRIGTLRVINRFTKVGSKT